MRRKKNDKRKYTFLAIFLIADLLLVVTIFRSSNARFVSDAVSATDLSVALYAVNLDEKDNEGNALNINIDNLEPDGKERYYLFTVKNTNADGYLTNTDIIYHLEFITTTNIDLDYKVREGTCTATHSNAIRTNVVSTDGSGSDAYFRTILTSSKIFGHEKEEENTYCLVVTFPKKYNTAQYQDLIESIQVKVVSKQRFDGELE